MLDGHRPVAVIDDDDGVLDSLKFMLEVAGYSVTGFPSAVDFLRDCQVHPSCMILDQHMPQMTGLQLAARLRSEGSQLPILLVTAAASPAIVAEAHRIGVDRVLEKPLDEQDILMFVAAHLDQGAGA